MLSWVLTISYAFFNRLYPFNKIFQYMLPWREWWLGGQSVDFDFCIRKVYLTYCSYNVILQTKHMYICWLYKITRLALTISVMRHSVLCSEYSIQLKETHHSVSLKYDSISHHTGKISWSVALQLIMASTSVSQAWVNSGKIVDSRNWNRSATPVSQFAWLYRLIIE